MQRGGALLQEGEVHGNVDLLSQAANIFAQEALPLAPRQTKTADWALTQRKLGRALLCIGALTRHLPHYEAAVAAYRSVLEVHPRSASPSDWADAQNNLGGALLGIGKQTRQLQPLEQAETAFRAALEIYTIDDMPKKWADAETNLGITHFLLGQFTGNATYYVQARDELAHAQPYLVKQSADSLDTILRQIERRIAKN
jgi:tetratricopeptide (TPR) repeat protein